MVETATNTEWPFSEMKLHESQRNSICDPSESCSKEDDNTKICTDKISLRTFQYDSIEEMANHLSMMDLSVAPPARQLTSVDTASSQEAKLNHFRDWRHSIMSSIKYS